MAKTFFVCSSSQISSGMQHVRGTMCLGNARSACHSKLQHSSLGLAFKFANPYKLRAVTASSGLNDSDLGITEDSSPEESTSGSSSVQAQLDLLDLLTTNNRIPGGEGQTQLKGARTIREQLRDLVPGEMEEITIPLGKRFKPLTYNKLTTAQKRNIRRQSYLSKVSERNDTRLFAGIALFVIVPPAIILSVAVATGYVNLLP
eukprot:TRINITY_DN1167_c0_g1_i3.p1 TRINITY_DN1167_c0_g1~~TRINITY_DN1167_c0_g1_i3.p1  ORF type:complete len:203 (-),score=30.53 TRINITY_DN1167_c0_g1_i3:216-824(-)